MRKVADSTMQRLLAEGKIRVGLRYGFKRIFVVPPYTWADFKKDTT